MSLDLPEIDLRQVISLTDDTGILQHSTYSTPNPWHGYCTDDNARALIAAVVYGRLRGFDDILMPLQRYLSFLVYAFDRETGRFRNFMDYARHWLEKIGSEDSHARTLWALGVAVSLAPNDSIKELANQLFVDALPAAGKFEYVRPWVYSLIGIDEYLRGGQESEEAGELRERLAERLLDTWRGNATDEWPWWENQLTWGNAKIPHAVLVAGNSLGNEEMVDAGLKALRWLLKVQTAPAGHITIIGNHGWFYRDKEMARFDQQPLEVHALVDACLTAARLTGDDHWADEAQRSFRWFSGENDLGLPLWNSVTGGCHDGLHSEGVNANQGAESTLAYVLSVLDLHMFERGRATAVEQKPTENILNYGLVGASKFGRFCAEQYSATGDIAPSAIWNRTASRAEAMASDLDIRSCESFDALLADPATSFVHIATTPAQHARQSIAALTAGKHVLCEKPIATSLEDADEVIDTAQKKDLKVSVNFMMRFGPLWEPVATIVQEQLLGSFLHGNVVNCAGDDQLTSGHWFWDATVSGGIFIEHGVHFFDLMRSWLGSGRVRNASQYHRPDSTVVDQVSCSVRYGSSGSVDFYHGFHQASALDRQEIRLIFEKGEIRLTGWVADTIEILAAVEDETRERLHALLDGPSVEFIRTFDSSSSQIVRRGRKDKVDSVVRITWSSGRESVATYGEALQGLVRDFAAAVRNPRYKLRIGADDARTALKLAIDATELAGKETDE